MASAGHLLSEEQFHCSICLDVFTKPVSIQCGHTFCKTCITKHWDSNKECLCPICKNLFCSRPDVHVNIVLSEMVDQFRMTSLERSSSIPDQQAARPGEVSCDICTEEKLKAIKSCLECQTSYCEIHLQPHYIGLALKKHQLIHPVENLEDRMCKKHDRPLQLFCRTDQTFVCQFCTETDHRTHKTVPLVTECEEKKGEMRTKDAELQQMIQERQQKIRQFQHSEDFSKEEEEREVADYIDGFSAMQASIERCQAELFEIIIEKQEAAEEKVGFIKELEQEITELKKRRTEMEELLLTEDHLHLLNSFPFLSSPPRTRDWSEVSVHSHRSVESVRTAVFQLKKTLSKEMGKLPGVELGKWCAVDATPSSLVFSGDWKQAKDGYEMKDLPDNPERSAQAVAAPEEPIYSNEEFLKSPYIAVPKKPIFAPKEFLKRPHIAKPWKTKKSQKKGSSKCLAACQGPRGILRNSMEALVQTQD